MQETRKFNMAKALVEGSSMLHAVLSVPDGALPPALLVPRGLSEIFSDASSASYTVEFEALVAAG